MYPENEEGYLALARDVLANGQRVSDRTGVGTRSLFGRQLRFDLTKGFPLLTTKKIFTKAIVHELLWFLTGNTNIAYLNKHSVSIWNEWADVNGDLGPVYGKQWRSWPAYRYAGNRHVIKETIDQITNVIESLRKSPAGRRHIVSAWNPAEVDEMALPPCHCLFQFYMRALTLFERQAIAETVECWTHGGPIFDSNTPPEVRNELLHADLDTRACNWKIPRYYLDCQLYQRSADLFLGVPFNIASYALLTHMVAQQVGAVAGEFVHTFGDVHIYNNHVDQVKLQLSREPMDFPQLRLTQRDSIFDYAYDDVKIVGYKSHSTISAPIAV